MSKLNWGKRFNNNSRAEVGWTGDQAVIRKTAKAPGHTQWWTAERIEKLIQCMALTESLVEGWEKASRVLGCDYRYTKMQWNKLHWEYIQAENAYEEYVNSRDAQ